MTKEQFLNQLGQGLEGMSPADIQKAQDFYAEMIDDRIEAGMTEDEATADIGTPEEAARQILIDMPLPKLIKAKAAPKKGLGPLAIILIILGFPVWGALLIAALAVLLSVYVVIWAVAISLFAVNFAVAVCAPAAIIAGVVFIAQGFVPAALLMLGGAAVCAGSAVIMFFVIKAAAKGIFHLSKLILRGIKSLFVK